MKDIIINYLRKTYPDLSDTNIRLLYGQAAFETGNFTSNLFKTNKNLYGILFVNQKFANGYTVRISDGYKFAKYNSYIDSINDRMRLYYVFYPEIIKSDDENKILDTWLYTYLGRNASEKTKNAYKAGVKKLSEIDLNYSIEVKKKSNTQILLLCALLLIIAKTF